MLSLPNVYSQRLPKDAQSTYLYAHGYTAVFAIKIYIRCWLLIFTATKRLVFTQLLVGGLIELSMYLVPTPLFSYILTSPHHGHLIRTLR